MLGDRRRRRRGAVAHHGDRVAEREDLVEAVGDEHHRARRASRRRRATANSRSTSTADSAAVGSSMISTRASSDSALAISTICWSAIDRPGGGAVAGRGARRAGRTARRPRRFIAAGRCRPPAQRLAAHEDVLGDRQVGEERRLLVDDRDARVARPARRAWSNGSPPSVIVPASRRCTPASTLTSVDLPAPFSPTSACTSPAREPQRRTVERDGTAEALDRVLHLENDFLHESPRPSRRVETTETFQPG